MSQRYFWGGWFNTWDAGLAQYLTEVAMTHVVASVAYVLDHSTLEERMQFTLKPVRNGNSDNI